MYDVRMDMSSFGTYQTDSTMLIMDISHYTVDQAVSYGHDILCPLLRGQSFAVPCEYPPDRGVQIV